MFFDSCNRDSPHVYNRWKRDSRCNDWIDSSVPMMIVYPSYLFYNKKKLFFSNNSFIELNTSECVFLDFYDAVLCNIYEMICCENDWLKDWI